MTFRDGEKRPAPSRPVCPPTLEARPAWQSATPCAEAPQRNGALGGADVIRGFYVPGADRRPWHCPCPMVARIDPIFLAG